MKQFLISEEERISILSKHKSLMKEQQKSLVNEQQNSSLEILTKAIKGGCIRNGKLFTTKNDPTKYVYRAVSDPEVKPPFHVDFFADMTYRKRESGKTGRWKMCQGAIDMERKAANDAAAAAETKKDNEAKIASLKQQNYKTKEDLVKDGVDLNTIDKSYDKQVIGNVALYKLKGDVNDLTLSGGTQDFDAKQQAFINKYTKVPFGYVLNPPREKRSQMVAVTAADLGADSDLFPNGLTLYYNPNVQKDLKTNILATTLQNQTIEKGTCKDNIESYWTAYQQKNSGVYEPSDIVKLKRVVQACKDQYYPNKWGILGGGKKINDYLDILSGVKEGGPMSYGEDSKWKLK